MADEIIPIAGLLALLNGITPQVSQPKSGFRKIAALVYTEGNVKVVMHKEDGGKHHLPHFHITVADAEAVFGLNGVILEGKIRMGSLITDWTISNNIILTNIWNELHKENPAPDYIASQKRLIDTIR